MLNLYDNSMFSDNKIRHFYFKKFNQQKLNEGTTVDWLSAVLWF